MKALGRWRRKHKLSPEDVASVAGVSRQTVYNWEKGKTQPRADTLFKLDRRWPGLLKLWRKP